jgi:hypothetical protein
LAGITHSAAVPPTVQFRSILLSRVTGPQI